MEEIKAFIEKAETMSKEELVKALPEIIEKAKAVGFVKVVKEFPELNDLVRKKMAEFEIDEALELTKKFMPLMFDAAKELVETSEDIAEELEDIEDTTVSLVVEDADFAITLIIKDGKFDYKMGTVENADLVMKMSKDTMKDFMAGEADPIQAYMSGDIKAEGNLTKAMALRSVLEALSDEFGFELMG
ncbi:MAG: SCP2 sterol-binding domain-containing protein [Candidatus Helarchaeota archaeon]